MLNFENTETAFRIKSDRDLRRAYRLYKLISYRWLVKTGNPLIRLASFLRLPIGWIVKPTVYRQFVGGETLESCNETVDKLRTGKVSAILDYSVEGKEDDKDIAAALEETLRSIRNAALNPNIPFAVFKPTAFAKTHALESMSTDPVPSKEVLNEGKKFRERVHLLCKAAHDAGIPLLIDAEDTWYQTYIDTVVMEMMAEFNRERAIVFNTYQMYRRDRLEMLRSDYDRAVKGNFFLGAKFVRGAYMEKERERARRLKYPDPIQPDKDSTDRDYNRAMEFSVMHIDRISVFSGTHNEKSSLYLTELMAAEKLEKNDPRIWFSQLYGMSDHISFNLADQGYNVAKYLPYGPVRYVLPYLMRRAEENTSVKGQTGRELNLISKEMKRRKLL
ncbi:MAG: proline dehydrogenase family protein [Bacteroidota bacterium]